MTTRLTTLTDVDMALRDGISALDALAGLLGSAQRDGLANVTSEGLASLVRLIQERLAHGEQQAAEEHQMLFHLLNPDLKTRFTQEFGDTLAPENRRAS